MDLQPVLFLLDKEGFDSDTSHEKMALYFRGSHQFHLIRWIEFKINILAAGQEVLLCFSQTASHNILIDCSVGQSTPAGKARSEDPLWKVVLLFKVN